jgi:xanthosine utilization system XapX-like protein
MRRELLTGIAAGAVGTVALNVVTYLDMTVRGRPASSIPAQAAGKLADQAGLHLGEGAAAQNRKEGLGALLGYLTGLGVGLVYGGVRSRLPGVPLPVAAVGLGMAAMAGSDVPIAAMGLTDPREWNAASWASDIVPHLAYGLGTAAAYEAFTHA